MMAKGVEDMDGHIPRLIYMSLITFIVYILNGEETGLGERLQVSFGGNLGIQNKIQMTLRLMMQVIF